MNETDERIEQDPKAEAAIEVLGNLMLAIQGFGRRDLRCDLSSAFELIVGRQPTKLELEMLI